MIDIYLIINDMSIGTTGVSSYISFHFTFDTNNIVLAIFSRYYIYSVIKKEFFKNLSTIQYNYFSRFRE